ncbi:T9SS type A sorting domain-containing protein [Capnocytophaga sp. ARDL2]|uniref:T9SS type A sorting domain-containing protein n=1 Tax=Capnocytophaga sp. ARDL2 TaxID=3238809 RepID=UPI003557C9FB
MKKLTVFLSLVVCITTHSQEVLWQKTIGGIYSDYLFDATATLDNGFLLAGSSLSIKSGNKNSTNKGNLDYFLWKIDSEGEQEWQISFGGDGADLLKSIAKTNDMGYLLGGYSNSAKSGDKSSPNFGKNDLWLVKINAKGELEWEKSYGGTGNDELIKVVPLPKGEFLILATSNSEAHSFKKQNGFGGLDFWILKIDAKGTILWEQTYGGSYNDEPVTAIPTENGYIIGGNSNSPQSGNKTQDNNGGYDFWIIKIDENGNLLEQFVFGEEQDDILNEIIYHKNTNSYLISITTYSSENQNDVMIVKTDERFTPVQQFSYNFGGNEFLTSTKFTQNNEFLLTGYKQDFKENTKNFLAFTIDWNGEKTWEKEISTTGNDVLRNALVTKDGGIVLAGHSDDKNVTYKKTSFGRDDYWVVKLHSKEKTKANEIELEAYPNPTENWTEIIVNHKYEKGEVNVYDVSGRLLHTEPIQYDLVPVNLSSYPTGAYIVNIKTDVFNGSVKVIRK